MTVPEWFASPWVRVIVYAVSAFLCWQGGGSRGPETPTTLLLALCTVGFTIAVIYQINRANRIDKRLAAQKAELPKVTGDTLIWSDSHSYPTADVEYSVEATQRGGYLAKAVCPNGTFHHLSLTEKQAMAACQHHWTTGLWEPRQERTPQEYISLLATLGVKDETITPPSLTLHQK